MTKWTRGIPAVLLCLTLSAVASEGGAQRGEISGVVTDPEGLVLPGVTVTIRSASGTERGTVTDERGAFRFQRLPNGAYSLRCELAGFQTYSMEGLVVGLSKTVGLKLAMSLASIAETVTVTAQSPLVQAFASQTASSESVSVLEALNRVRVPSDRFITESYDYILDNPFERTLDHPLSTFSTDVDTASYANVRRFLEEGELPPKDAVRIEELVNYFRYDDPAPEGRDPLAIRFELAPSPWRPEHRLLRIGIQARRIDLGARPSLRLVFLVDVSGSMADANKLPLVQRSLRLLTENLREDDRLAIVVYAGASGLVLPPTSGAARATILDALSLLSAGGTTNGGEGIELAYRTAGEIYEEGAVNRVVLATDGDFNVGVTDEGELVRLIEEKARTGVFLTALGFGMGNYKDSTLEKLADRGNGNYAYIDTEGEARKVLVEEMTGTLVTVAKDVKLQIEFNPALVEAYRLLGYENRMLAEEDFEDDAKDAGDVGAGHHVTALYELVPAGEPMDLPEVAPLAYQRRSQLTKRARSGELLRLALRYKEPDGQKSRLLERVLRAEESVELTEASADFKFVSAVAGFGMVLRDSPYRGEIDYEDVLVLAREGVPEGADRYRLELLELVAAARDIAREMRLADNRRR